MGLIVSGNHALVYRGKDSFVPLQDRCGLVEKDKVRSAAVNGAKKTVSNSSERLAISHRMALSKEKHRCATIIHEP